MMCHNGKHEMTPENVKVKRQRDRYTGKVYEFDSCRACAADRQRRYDSSWKGQERFARMNEKRRVSCRT